VFTAAAAAAVAVVVVVVVSEAEEGGIVSKVLFCRLVGLEMTDYGGYVVDDRQWTKIMVVEECKCVWSKTIGKERIGQQNGVWPFIDCYKKDRDKRGVLHREPS
jgi:hypothetical protein